MRYFFLLLILLSSLSNLYAQITPGDKKLRFLALGDSYTIGKKVAPEERWPEQLSDSLESLGFTVEETYIRAVTGWTTGDLLFSLETSPPDLAPNLVSLLIGVNNQYQNRSISEYESEFEELLQIALNYVQGNKDMVFVLSIPDYAFTPFGRGMQETSDEIDAFNAINKKITDRYGIPYVNITDISRMGLDEPDLVATDGLHPSGKQYTLWVQRILTQMNLENLALRYMNNPDISLTIFPNPSAGQVSLDYQSPEFSESVFLMDSLGRIAWEGRVYQGINNIDLGFLKPGLYYFSLRNPSLSGSFPVIFK